MQEVDEVMLTCWVQIPVFLSLKEIEVEDPAEYHVRVVDHSEKEERNQHRQSVVQIQTRFGLLVPSEDLPHIHEESGALSEPCKLRHGAKESPDIQST